MRKRPYASWVTETVFFKLIPAEGHAISAVEAAVQQALCLEEMSVDIVNDVKAVRIRTQKPAFTIINKSGPLRNAADRDHCLQYIVAVVLLMGRAVEVEDYADDSPWATDERVDELRKKIEVVEDEVFTRDYEDQKKRSGANAILVTWKDGRELSEVVVEFPIGHPGRADTLDHVREKFRRNMGLSFDGAKIDEMVSAVEKDEMLVHEFVDLFFKG